MALSAPFRGRRRAPRARPAPPPACPRSAWCRTPSRRCGRPAPITRSMSCSTSRMHRPSPRSWRSTSASACFSLRRRPAAGSSSSSRVGSAAQRARDLHQPLLAERQVAGLLVHQLAHADALQLALGLAQQAALLGAVEAQHRRRHAVAAAQVRAERDVLEHRHAGDHLHVLEGARDAAPGDLARRQRRRCAGRAARPRRASAGSTPVTRLKMVDLPAPFGPIRPTISPARTWKLTSLTATRPPNSLRAARTSSTTSPCGGLARAGSGAASAQSTLRRDARQRRVDEGPEAVARVLQHQHEQDAEDDDLVVAAGAHQLRQPDLQLVLQDLARRRRRRARPRRGRRRRAPP